MNVNGLQRSPADSILDAVVTASRVLVAMAARSLADAGEEVTLTQYRSFVVLASAWTTKRGGSGRGRGRHSADGFYGSSIGWSGRVWCDVELIATTGVMFGSV